MVSVPSFANILLSGPCNLSCPACIGQQLDSGVRRSNLQRWPLLNLERFAALLLDHGIRELSLTGVDTEPMLYRHAPRLVRWLRNAVPGVRLSLHTNGTLILRRPAVFNCFDRATVSLPSFEPATCLAMTGSARVLDLQAIVRVARIPLKLSTLVTEDNRGQLPELLARCASLGVRRMVLRRPWQHQGAFEVLPGHQPVGRFAENPVYRIDGMEVTVWDFHRTRIPCVNLLADGTITTDYVLSRSGHG
jgi:MoaA/NifB/PqqE/SkfB family radical SAM enzyme